MVVAPESDQAHPPPRIQMDFAVMTVIRQAEGTYLNCHSFASMPTSQI